MSRVSFAFLVVFFLIPGTATAWVQTMTCLDEPAPAPTSTPFCQRNEIPKPFAWPQWTVPYRVNEEGYSAVDGGGGEISDALLESVRGAVEAWNEPGCSDFRFEYDGLTTADGYDIDDGINVVVFNEEAWPYAHSAIAITSVTAELDGTIVNADMEINVVHNEFGHVEEDGDDVWDIRNTITHEAGHMVGLDHSPVDGATMGFNATPGEIEKRDLAEDDIEGVCAIYPEGEEPLPPDPEPEPEPGSPRRGCCAVAPGSPAEAPLLPFVPALLLARFLRGRRHRT